MHRSILSVSLLPRSLCFVLLCLSLPWPSLSILRYILSLTLLLYSVCRSILSVSLLPRNLYLALLCLSPFSFALYYSLYSVALPPPSLSILRSILSVSHLPRSPYLALLSRSPFSIALHTSLQKLSGMPKPKLCAIKEMRPRLRIMPTFMKSEYIPQERLASAHLPWQSVPPSRAWFGSRQKLRNFFQSHIFSNKPTYAYLPLFKGSWNMQQHWDADLFCFDESGGFSATLLFVALGTDLPAF